MSESDLTPVQCFLDHCVKRKYTSNPVSVYDFLERQDLKIFRKVSKAKGHPLLSVMLELNHPATILGKNLVLNLRLTLCVLKTHVLIV